MVHRPHVNVFQRFLANPIVERPEMLPVIVGPRHDFLDYSLAEDKPLAYVGDYDPDTNTDYAYPEKATLSTIVEGTVKVFLDNAKLRYLRKLKADTTYQARVIAKARNRLTTVASVPADRLTFRNYVNIAGTSFLKSAVFDGRDVTVGDSVVIKGTVGPDIYTTEAEVTGYINDQLPSEIGAVVAGSTNQELQTHSIAVTDPPSGISPSGDTLAASGTYVGSMQNGVILDEYVITVITQGVDPVIDTPVADVGNVSTHVVVSGGGFGGAIDDVYTIEAVTGTPVMFNITSLLGDDVSGVTTAFATPVAVGTQGVTITFTDDGSGIFPVGDKWTISVATSNARLSVYSDSKIDDHASVVFPGFGEDFDIGSFGVIGDLTDGGDSMLTLGEQWTVLAVKAVDAVVATSGGEYVHTKDLEYVTEVTRGGVWGECQVISTSSGIDSSGPFTVSAHSTDVPIGTKGATIQFATNAQGGLVVGDKFVVLAENAKNGSISTLILSRNIDSNIILAGGVVESFTATTGGTSDTLAASGGSYSDDIGLLSQNVKEIYTVTISTPGAPGVAKYTVTSSSGLDDMVATSITAYGVAHAVGSNGVTITFTAGAVPDDLLTGDVWTIDVNGVDLDVDWLLPRNNYELPQLRQDIGFQNAWDWDGEKVTLNSDIKLFDDDWYVGAAAIPVDSAKVYIEYQAIRTAVVGSIDYLEDRDKIEDEVGRISINNPLAYAIDKAMENMPNKPCYYFPVVSNDEDGYVAFLHLAENINTIYSIVPLTFDADVHDKIISHVDEFSVPEHAKWRRTLICREREERNFIFDSWLSPNDTEEQDYRCTVTDYVDTSATDYVFVEASADGAPNFIQEDVREGDILRTRYRIDAQGFTAYDEYVIEGVVSETTLLIKTGPSGAVTTPEKFTLYRNLDSSEVAETMANKTELIDNRRVTAVYPDYITDNDDYIVPGYYACAAIAGMVGATPPHQGLTNYRVSGFKDVPRTFIDMTQSDLDKMADGGWLLLVQDTIDDPVYIRHQLTTDVSTIEFQEMSISVNVDNISYFIKAILDPVVGVFNITEDTIEDMRARIDAGFEDLKTIEDPRIGGQLIDAKILSIAQDPVLKDHVSVESLLTIPYPMNVLNVHLII